MTEVTQLAGAPAPSDSVGYFLCGAALVISRCLSIVSVTVTKPDAFVDGAAPPIKGVFRWRNVINLVLSFFLLRWPVAAIAVSTTCVLMSERNFRHALLRHSSAESNYGDLAKKIFQETQPLLFLACVFGQTLLMMIVGGTLLACGRHVVSLGIGAGVIIHAVVLPLSTLWPAFVSKGPVSRVYRKKLLHSVLFLISLVLNFFAPPPPAPQTKRRARAKPSTIDTT